MIAKENRKELTLDLGEGVSLVLVCVPAGEFTMGNDYCWAPIHKVYLDEYWIGKAPVTLAQFEAFVKASGYRFTFRQNLKVKANHPVTDVTWRDAHAFCMWLAQKSGINVRLPSEAEWEKAARGTDGREYPWGNEAPHGLCNYFDMIEDTTPVGNYSPDGDSPFGCVDMAGNVWEWTGDYFAYEYYNTGPFKNPTGPENGEHMVKRGGSWKRNPLDCRSAWRGFDSPNNKEPDYGFRLAATIQA